ncbi:MAG: TetR/AcrR family transcriptional regulator [Vulcanimicrobiaceae bacterium]
MTARDVVPVLGEVFRENGFSGTSLSHITEATGLGRGSLYHFFPGGKAEMAEAVLDEITAWFRDHVFEPLRRASDPMAAISTMFDAVDAYFQSGRRICLVGAFVVSDVRDQFAERLRDYFERWRDELAAAFVRAKRSRSIAIDLADDVVGGIQGALILARALDEPRIFTRAIRRLRARAIQGS